MAVWWRRAGQRNQVGLLGAIELGPVLARARSVGAQRRRQALFDEALAQALDGRDADLERFGNASVAPSRPARGLVSLEQDLRVLEPAHVRLAAREQLAQLRALVRRQRDPIFLRHS